MDLRSIFEIWAPPHGPWSPWAKPVLFAHLDVAGELPSAEIPEIRLPFDRPKQGGTAIVVDLPSLESIGLGLELARRGYRPVPLFNACPSPPGFHGEAVPEVVPVTPLLSALVQGTDRLKAAGLSGDAPPAFLLDADRLGRGGPIAAGWFDNRWVVFATDLPSARFLAQHQITAVELVHRGAPGEDVLDVLGDWNRAGISLWHTDLDRPGPASAFAVPGTWLPGLSRLARRLWALLSLRRNRRGGYGGIVPESESFVG
jgi:hypothetical protein